MKMTYDQVRSAKRTVQNYRESGMTPKLTAELFKSRGWSMPMCVLFEGYKNGNRAFRMPRTADVIETEYPDQIFEEFDVWFGHNVDTLLW